MTVPKGHHSALSGSILCSLSPQELLPQAWGGLGKERIVILLLLRYSQVEAGQAPLDQARLT